jgi:hypothetical protein
MKPGMKSRLKAFNIEEAVAQTLERRFKKEIPKIIPDCCVDLMVRKSGGRDVNLAVFSKTGKIEAFEIDRLAGTLVERGVKEALNKSLNISQ